MKYSVAIAGLLATALSKEIPKDPERAKLYDSGFIHDQIMQSKESFWNSQEEMSLTNSAAGPYYPELHFAQCKEGKAIPFRDEPNNFYRCNNVSI